jgi:serine/threonine-protein kinase
MTQGPALHVLAGRRCPVADPLTPADSNRPGRPASDPTVTSPAVGEGPPPADSLAAPADSATTDEPSADQPFALRRPSVTLPEETGRYVIRGEIAHGGMGAVLLGYDKEMERDLAVKVLRDGSRRRPERMRRFLTEARVCGRLQHPGIVPIYDLGRFADDRPYFTMKLVQGRTLAALLAERQDLRQDRPRFLQVFEQVCQAVAYAHSHRVIHRDLKPSNVMVGAFGEVQVMDWGLAKALGGPAEADPAEGPPSDDAPAAPAAGATVAGSVLGTLAYMPPEQARGEIDSLDERSDVFGLGAVLCEILTGRPPYTGGSEALAARAAAGDLAEAHARLDACGADPELLRLARACLASEPRDRPRDAGAVAGAVTAYLAGVQERLRAAEIDRAAAQAREAEARAKAAAERRARRLTLGLAASLLVLAGLAGGAWYWRQQERAAADAAVRDALVRGEDLHGRARREKANLVLWAEAVAALEKAQALADGGPGEDELRDQVHQALDAAAAGQRQARARAEAEAANRRLLARLEEAYLQLSEWDRGRPDATKRVADTYARLFRELGVDVDRLRPEEAAASIRAYPAPVVLALAGGLDQWVQADWAAYWLGVERDVGRGRLWNVLPLTGGGGQPGLLTRIGVWRRRLAVAQLADPDPMRNRLRDAVMKFDLVRFQKIVRSADPATLPADTLQIMAVILAHIGESRQAADLLRRAVLVHPDDYLLHIWLGNTCTRLRPPAWEEAARHLAAATSLRPERPGPWRLLGLSLMKLGQNDEALGVFRRLVRQDPRDDVAHHDLGVLLWQKGDRKGAVMHGREAARLRPAVSVYHFQLGSYLQATGDLAGAVPEYEAAARLGPKDEPAQRLLGRALLAQGRRAEAVGPLRRAAQLEPKSVENWLTLGRVLRQLGRGGEADMAFRQAAKADPNHAATQVEVGRALLDAGKVNDALTALRQGLRKGVSSEGAYFVATALFRKGSAAAAAYLEDRAEPGTALVGMGYAGMLLRAGRREDYHRCCATLRRRFGRTASADEAFLTARSLALGGGDPAEAVRLAEQAVKATPTSPYYLNALALAHLRDGEVDQAVRRAQESLRTPGWYPSLNWLVLALADLQLGRVEPARQWLARVRGAGGVPPGMNPQDQLYYLCLREEAEARLRAAGGK